METFINVKIFNPQQMKRNSVCFVYGDKGKTTLSIDLLRSHNINSGTVITKCDSYRDVITTGTFCNYYDPSFIQEFNREHAANAGRCLVIDDCITSFDKELRQVFFNGRNWKIFFLFSLTNMIHITPVLATNIDWIFIFNERDIETRQKLYSIFGCRVVNSFDLFCKLLDSLNQFECIVIDNHSSSNKIEDLLYFYRVEA